MATIGREILKIEGGYDNDPHDLGGETNFGICKRSYPSLDIKTLTEEKAFEIYERDYWNKNRFGEINSQSLANAIFYFSVNAGAKPAIKIIQRILDSRGFRVVDDGIMGDKTLQSINFYDSKHPGLVDSFKLKVCEYYLNIVKRDKSQQIFLKGWFHRVLDN